VKCLISDCIRADILITVMLATGPVVSLGFMPSFLFSIPYDGPISLFYKFHHLVQNLNTCNLATM
jgi:hypothetical protein